MGSAAMCSSEKVLKSRAEEALIGHEVNMINVICSEVELR